MIAENIKRIKNETGNAVQLIVVSKFRTIEEIKSAYDAGHRVFAENRVQALLERKTNLPDDIQWHLIGHLQTNKVKNIAPFITMIQSVDSLKLLSVIDKEAISNKRVIDALIQIHVAKEDTKFGFEPSEFLSLLENNEFDKFKNIRIRGIMGMATLSEDQQLIESEFKELKMIFDDAKGKFNSKDFDVLSMGMSSDYKLAVKCGSTMIRVGSSVFA